MEKTNTRKQYNFGNSIFYIPYTIFHWCTATRLRKILSSTLAVLILFTSIRYIFLTPKIVLADSTLGFDEGYGTTVTDGNNTLSGTITGAAWKSEEYCNRKMFVF